MIFNKDFFEDEVRDGFYVPAMMKRCWAAQMEVLQHFSDFCKEYGLHWFAAYGTLLGAVRHQGFIPWDDDIDIWMLRSDYERFIRLSDHLPGELRLYEGRLGNKKEFNQPFARLTNTEIRDKGLSGDPVNMKQFMEEYHGFLDLSGIDIFPLDRLAPTNDEEEDRYAASRIVLYLLQHYASDQPDVKKKIRTCLDLVDRWQARPIDRNGNLFRQLMVIFEDLNMRFELSGTREVTAMHDWISYRNYRFPIECFRETVELPFENMRIPAPVGYKEVLSRWNKDYMKPIKILNHDYPGYRAFEESCAEAGTPLMYLYQFKKDDLEKSEKSERGGILTQLKNQFHQAHISWNEWLSREDGQALYQALGDAQNLCEKISRVLQKCYPDEYKDFSDLLEQYYENIFQFYQIEQGLNCKNSGDETAKKLIGTLNSEERALSVALQEKIIKPKEIVFLPFKYSGWKKMESVVQFFRNQTDFKVYVSPVSWYRKDDFLDLIREPVNENEKIAKETEIVSSDQILLSVHTPDILVTQNPYDEFSTGMSVDPAYYSRELQKYASEVIYLPWFSVDEGNLDNGACERLSGSYIQMPGLVRADCILTDSEKMRNLYVQKLTEMSGDDLKEEWEHRVHVLNPEDGCKDLLFLVNNLSNE